MKLRHLTKSKFKTGHQCSNKLYFLGNKNFLSNNVENEILLALAVGGFQVVELAKIYFLKGVDITRIRRT